MVGTHLGHYGMDIGNGDPWRGGPWFEQLHDGYKFLSVLFIVAMVRLPACLSLYRCLCLSLSASPSLSASASASPPASLFLL